MDVPVHRRSLPSRPAGGAAGTRWRAGKATAVGLLVAMASACASGAGSGGSSGSSASSTSSTSTSSSTTAPLSAAPGATATATRTTKSVQATPSTPAKPVATESNPPGDIPDNQVFVAFHPQGAKVSVKVPEGWARTGPPSDTVFTDKLNRIEIRPGRASAPPTPTSVRNQVARLRTQVPRFAMGSVKQVSRTSGHAVLLTYQGDSRQDPVTGKVVRDAFEQYTFYRSGRLLTLTLSGPTNADNVDPWRIVSDSVRWL